MTNSDGYVPKIITKKEAAEEARIKIREERNDGQRLGVRCRYHKINIAVGKQFRFGEVYLLGGLSGNLKSTFLNIFLNDFKNKDINPHCDNIIIVHHTWEMKPSDEVIRDLGTKTKKSYLYVLSSDYDIENHTFNKLSDVELLQYEQILDEVKDDGIYYFEEPCLAVHIINNIEESIRKYRRDKNNPKLNPSVILSIDHTLLQKVKEKETLLDAMFTLAKVCIYLKKKHKCLIFLIGQLNGEIEKSDRIKNNNSHYPKKSDIYAQAQIYNVCDGVFISHVPSKLGIQKYGIKNIVTVEDNKELIHFLMLKNRFGKSRSIYFLNNLDNGLLIQK
jgi:hypothetical protein